MGNECCNNTNEDQNEALKQSTQFICPKNESTLNAFGDRVSSFFTLSADQRETIAKRGLKYDRISSLSSIRQMTSANIIGYEGEVDDINTPRFPHGFGHMLNIEKDFLVGQFVQGLIIKWSVIYFENGDYLEINSVTSIDESNRFSSFVGQGTHYSKDGRSYEGQFVNGKKDGDGNGNRDGNRDGNGNGNGNGNENGNGTCNLQDGFSLTGQRNDGISHILGKLTDKNGEISEGKFASGMMIEENLEPIKSPSEVSKFIIEASKADLLSKADFFHLSDEQCDTIRRIGSAIYAQVMCSSVIERVKIQGNNYEGEIEGGVQHGVGQMLNPDGDFLVGKFQRGRITSGAEIFFKNGDYVKIYSLISIDESNSFRSFIGKAMYCSLDGTKYFGDFFNGYKEGYGELYSPTGAYYSGEWKNGMVDGEGKVIDKSGKTFHGRFSDGMLFKII